MHTEYNLRGLCSRVFGYLTGKSLEAKPPLPFRERLGPQLEEMFTMAERCGRYSLTETDNANPEKPFYFVIEDDGFIYIGIKWTLEAATVTIESKCFREDVTLFEPRHYVEIFHGCECEYTIREGNSTLLYEDILCECVHQIGPFEIYGNNGKGERYLQKKIVPVDKAALKKKLQLEIATAHWRIEVLTRQLEQKRSELLALQRRQVGT